MHPEKVCWTGGERPSLLAAWKTLTLRHKVCNSTCVLIVVEILQTEHYCYKGVSLTFQNILAKHFVTSHTIELGKKESIGPDGRPAGDTAAYGFTSYFQSGRVSLTETKN
jgi:hypothetical protein